MTESDLCRRIVLALCARGHFVWKNHGSVYSYKGLADVTGMRRGTGVFVGLEVKMPERRRNVSPEQWKFLRDVLRTAPEARVGVVTSVAEAINVVEGEAGLTLEQIAEAMGK